MINEIAIELTEEQIRDALNEISKYDDSETDEIEKGLDTCAKNLHNIELEEQEQEANNKGNKPVHSFSLSANPNEKLPPSVVAKRKRADIKKALALSGNTDLLVTFLTRDTKAYILACMIQPYKAAIEKANTLINLRIERLLNALIPSRLRADRATFGQRPFVKHPGFFWLCGEDVGYLKIWVEPDIIYYFEQHTEMAYLHKAYAPSVIKSVDKLVEKYLKAVANLKTRSNTLRARLTRVDDYEGLLNFNPDLAEELLDEILSEKNLSIKKILEIGKAEDII